MAAESEEWIQSSLGRLEAYEELRTECREMIESADGTAGDVLMLTLMSTLEDKINKLYSALESAAEQSDTAPPAEPTPVEAPPAGLNMPASLTSASGSIGEGGKPERSKTMTSVPQFGEVQQRYAVVSKAASVDEQPAAAAAAPAPVERAPHRGDTLHLSPPPQPAPVVAHPGDAARQPARPATPFAFSSTPRAAIPAAVSQPQAPVAATSAQPFAFSSNVNQSGVYGASDTYFNNLGFDDEDLRLARRSRPRWGLIAAVVLVGGGVGGYIAYDQYYAPKPEVELQPAAPIQPRVIKAPDVPPDTQGPGNVAKNEGDVSQTAGTQIEERRRGGRAAPRQLDPPPRRSTNTKVKNTDDPLDGFVGG